MSITKDNAPDDIFGPDIVPPRRPEPRSGDYLVFDIETLALPDEQLAGIPLDIQAPANYKDPAKIRDYIDAARIKWKEDAALSAITGRVAMIGTYAQPSQRLCVDVAEGIGQERQIIADFWEKVATARYLIGWNIKGFDLPFIIQRSHILGIRVPSGLLFSSRYFNSDFVIDLMEMWCCYGRDRAALGDVARACGLGEKTAKGSDFGRLWAEDLASAKAYCMQDVQLTSQLAKRMGVHP
jgi:DNA polymerase elongation subunit (family B)